MFIHERHELSLLVQARETKHSRARRVRLSALHTLMLGIMAAGCGDRYQLGETAQTLDDGTSPPGLDSLAVLIVNGAEDTDGITSRGNRLSKAVGDVDGDGYDDWLSLNVATRRQELAYGGPRGAAGTFPDADVLTEFSFALAAESGAHWHTRAAGDVDGDGHADLLFSTHVDSQRGPRAYLWYGGSERVPEVDLDSAAVHFDALLETGEGFAPELDGDVDLAAEGYFSTHRAYLFPVGDIDADGYADFGHAHEVAWYQSRESASDTIADPAGPVHVEGRTELYYGGSSRWTARGATAAPAARLVGVASIGALGDIDGDGYPEFQVRGPRAGDTAATSLLRGAARRLSGVVDVSESAVPIAEVDGMTLVQGAGDLDRDGYDDFIVTRRGYDDVTTYLFHADLFYGGPDRLNAPLTPASADARFSMDAAPAELVPVGDWNGDGHADLGVQQSVRRGDEPCLGCWNAEDPLWTGEARIIPGASERYSGSYATTTLRSDLELRDPAAPSGPTGIAPVGDIDGDGFTDLLLDMAIPHSSRTYVKYGAPLRRAIR